jgi:hypothetical protein
MASVKLATLAIRVCHFHQNWPGDAIQFPSLLTDNSEANFRAIKDICKIVRVSSSPCRIFYSEHSVFYTTRNQRFREFCIGLAQRLWRIEIRLRETMLGEVHGTVRPLNDAKWAS